MISGRDGARGGVVRQQARATGADGPSEQQDRLAQKDANSRAAVQRNAVSCCNDLRDEKCGIAEGNMTRGHESSGWGGIRTPGTVSRTAVFKTAALVHSATHPTPKKCCMTNDPIPLRWPWPTLLVPAAACQRAALTSGRDPVRNCGCEGPVRSIHRSDASGTVRVRQQNAVMSQVEHNFGK